MIDSHFAVDTSDQRLPAVVGNSGWPAAARRLSRAVAAPAARKTTARTAQPAGVLGRVRAGLLAVLGEPASGSELAVRLGVSAPAVNQHLRALQAAGLLTSGRHVLYVRSELGDRLVGVARA